METENKRITMTKPIAERFLNFALNIKDDLSEIEIAIVHDWLQHQPENAKIFSLEEVREIALEASRLCFRSDFQTFENWWASKIAEWRLKK